jgi:hypothetical protein
VHVNAPPLQNSFLFWFIPPIVVKAISITYSELCEFRQLNIIDTSDVDGNKFAADLGNITSVESMNAACFAKQVVNGRIFKGIVRHYLGLIGGRSESKFVRTDM